MTREQAIAAAEGRIEKARYHLAVADYLDRQRSEHLAAAEHLKAEAMRLVERVSIRRHLRIVA